MREAIRLARLSVALLPEQPEAQGLLALMLLTDSRRRARISEDGELVPLDIQDRSLWDRAEIDEGISILDEAFARGAPGPYQVQASIAALHATAPTPEATDWRQISALYITLLKSTPTPVVELNAAVAFGLATSLEGALAWIERLEMKADLARYHLLPASKAEVLRRLGRLEEAAAAYGQALALVTNPAERQYLQKRLSSCLI